MNRVLKGTLAALALIGALTLVTEVVLAGVLYFAGVLTTQKAMDLVKGIQGELASAPEEALVEGEVWADPLDIQDEEELKEAVERWRRQKAAEQEQLRLREHAVDALLRELAMVEQSIDARQGQIEDQIANFEAARAAEIAARSDAGFQRAVEHYTKMDAGDVAELLYGLSDAEIVMYIEAFKVSLAAEVLTEIKKVDEKQGGGGLNRAALLQELLRGEQVALATGTAASAAAR